MSVTHDIKLEQVTELRMGPPLFELRVDGTKFKNRTFFASYISDLDNTKIAITECTSTSHDSHLISILWLMDLELKKAYQISFIEDGTIRPVKFETTKLIYEKQQFGIVGREYERDLSDLALMKSFDF